MNFDKLLAILGAVAGTGILGYIFGAKKERAEAGRTETANIADNLEIYQRLIDDLKKQFSARLLEMEAEINELRAELEKCKNQFRPELDAKK